VKPDIQGIGMTSFRTRERLIQRLRAGGINDSEVLDSLRAVPRHVFIDEALASRAYEDTALPIGYGQTISQPYIVARMCQCLRQGRPLHNVLEVGTGSGYQTAVLSRLAERVYTIERIDALLKRARLLLRRLGVLNAQFRHADGSQGWPEQAPFDGIVVSAAPADIPPPLLAQLAPGARLVIPVGDASKQELLVIQRNESDFTRERLELVNFVPLVKDRL
jgi:protein-L-isoaspartate(D-aspartate) O-methyltransferase